MCPAPERENIPRHSRNQWLPSRISFLVLDSYHTTESLAAMDYYTTLAASIATLSFIIAATVVMRG